MIVDDSALARLMLRDALNGIEGVRVVGNAAEGSAALDVIDAVKPDLVILDVEMPGLTGIELQEELRAHHVDLPIVFLTGHGDIPMTVKAMKAGAVDFLPKPVSNERLLEVVRQATG